MSSITMATSVPATSVPDLRSARPAGSPGLPDSESKIKLDREKVGFKCRNVCWTLNNYTDAQVEYLRKHLPEETSYTVFGFEVGESGTPHLQGYSEFQNPRATGPKWSNFKSIWNCSGVHFESRRGTAKQAAVYCKKDDDYLEYGTMSQQGHRTDWDLAISTLDESPVRDVIQAQPQLCPAIRALERYKQLSYQPIVRDVHVVVLYGETGTGKSTWAWEFDENLYNKPTGMWWDAYEGESTVLLDDFYGEIVYSELLKVLDKYKYRVPYKGGFVACRWNKVFITSNKHPSEWYPDGLTPALKRRINEIWFCPSIGKKFLEYSINGPNVPQENIPPSSQD